MNDDEMKRLWKNQPLPPPAATPADVAALVTEAREGHRRFQRMILWRDYREVGVALVLIPLFLYWALRPTALWTAFLPVFALVFVAAFLVIDRLRRRRGATTPGESVVEALEGALREVEHQIWLLRNILWWYLGPLMGSLTADASYEWLCGKMSGVDYVVCMAIFIGVGVWIWWENQRAVRCDLEPRRKDLQAVLEQVR